MAAIVGSGSPMVSTETLMTEQSTGMILYRDGEIRTTLEKRSCEELSADVLAAAHDREISSGQQTRCISISQATQNLPCLADCGFSSHRSTDRRFASQLVSISLHGWLILVKETT